LTATSCRPSTGLASRYLRCPSKQGLLQDTDGQGDQMSLWKSRPKCIPTIFESNLKHSRNRGKK
jgi:hypothetical protein